MTICKQYKIKDLFDITGGSTPSTKDESLWNGEVLWYTPIDLNLNKHTERKIVKNNKYLSKGSVMISSRAPIGYLNIAKEKCWHSQGVKGFENISNSLIENKYFYYLLITMIDKIISLGSGSTFQEISKRELGEIEIEIPPINEQQKIIDIIEPIESLYLKYSKTINISTFEQARIDIEKLIDIIEPIEKSQEKISKVLNAIINLISKLSLSESKVKLGEVVEVSKMPPMGIEQISAKVMKRRDPTISNYEDFGTYKTNTFFCKEKTLLINTIRTYLNKFAILPFDADVNGTSIQVKVNKDYETSILNGLLSDEFWIRTEMYSQGTKMPVIKKQDLLNIEINLVKYELANIFDLIIVINKILIKIEKAKNELIRLLVD